MSSRTAKGNRRSLHRLTSIRDGAAYSTRDHLAPRLADRPWGIDDGLTTIVVATRYGGFLVDSEEGGADVCDGRELADLLRPVRGIDADLRIWLDWPAEPAEQTRLRVNLQDLATMVGAVVWTPPAGGRCEVEPASGDLCSLDGAGAIAAWAATFPLPGVPLRYTSDPDGRLMPADGFLTAHIPGVALVSVPGPRLWSMTTTYTRVRDIAGVFPIDVMLTAAGQLAACRWDGTPFPLGPHHLARMLSAHGWRGEEIVLLTEVPRRNRAGLRQYLDDVAQSLGRRLPVIADGSWTLAGREPLAAETPMSRRPLRAARPNQSAARVARRAIAWQAPAGATSAEALESLAAAVTHVAAELHDLQRRCRVLAAGSPAVADALLDDWYGLYLQLVEARYATKGPSMWDGRAPTFPEDFDAARCRSNLERAHTILRDSIRMAGSGSSTVDDRATGVRVAPTNSRLPIVDERWLRHVRPAIAVALANLDGAASRDARQMRQLADAIAAYARPRAAPATDDDVRMLLERLVIRPEPEPDGVAMAGSSDPPASADADADAAIETDDHFGPDPTRSGDWAPTGVFLARPRLGEARRSGTPHGLVWLKVHPQVNEEQFDLFVASLWPPARAATDGIPSGRLFLLGHLDPPTSAPYVVQVRVGPQGAIDVPASGGRPPSTLSGLLESRDAYVLPAAWLDHSEIVLRDGDRDDRTVTTVPARLHLLEALYGVDELPGDALTWRRRGRVASTAYAVLDESGQLDDDRLRLYRLRPPARAGRLVRLRVGRGSAVDVRRTAAHIAAMPFVSTTLPELQAEGVDAVLPRKAFTQVIVTGSFVAEDGRWRDAATGPLGRWVNLDYFLRTMTGAPSPAG